jgi:hypothetical protein
MIVEWMDRFVEFATTWLGLVLLATWRTLPMLVLVIGIVLVLRRKLMPSVHALLLTIVVVRLLIPISIGSPLSLHKPIDDWFSGDTEESVNQNWSMNDLDYRYALLPNDVRDDPERVQVLSPQTFDFTLEEILYVTLALSFISVSIGLLFRSVFSHARFALGLRSSRILDDRRFDATDSAQAGIVRCNRTQQPIMRSVWVTRKILNGWE